MFVTSSWSSSSLNHPMHYWQKRRRKSFAELNVFGFLEKHATSALVNQPTLHSGGVIRGRVCGCCCWPWCYMSCVMCHVSRDMWHIKCDIFSYYYLKTKFFFLIFWFFSIDATIGTYWEIKCLPYAVFLGK